MRASCLLKIRTFCEEESFVTEMRGEILCEEDRVTLYYEHDGHESTARLSSESATVTRRGKMPYTLDLALGKSTAFDCAGLTAQVTTEKLALKRGSAKIDFLAKYTLGGARNTIALHAEITE